jgi:hypothetical protein
MIIGLNDLQLSSGNLHNEKGIFSPYYRELLGVKQDLPSFR